MMGTVPYWYKHAPCIGLSDMFMSEYPSDRVRAQKVCATCKWAEECLQWALDTEQIYGVWGGKTGPELQRMRVDNLN